MIETLTTLATSLGLGVGAGVNAYATFLIYGLLARFFPALTGSGELSSFFSSTPVLIALGVLYTIEFFADKIPAVDHVWDAMHTFIRPLAGALIGLVSASPDAPAGLVATAAILGGGAALGSHVAKSSLRAASTATTGGAANPILSVLEDVFVLIQSVVAVFLPYLVLAFLLLVALPGFFIILAVMKRRGDRAAAS
jgi:hypothetical protein